ncbi:ATP-binding protein [Streptomyces sp. YC504]|uniref:ATP-binding protein n=1 Tax=Streptomyces mesophilus TaxID=1775132 RepID=A0A6G4XPB0_9ACTN|nr:ATP-binding protein [Streptomyces mesophilus]NGO78451.1 ATP-binding protein [Streptomyces mesophilus]
MNLPAQNDSPQSLVDRLITVSVAFEGSEEIAESRVLARSFLADLQEVHGLAVSDRVTGTVQLVVSELVTNTLKYAPGPCLLTLEAREGTVEVTVWDSDPRLPTAQATDPSRVGQHGLEIVMALCHSFAMHREPVGKRITATVLLADDPIRDEADRQAE